jgi:ABC-2 type transport system ATP-binding protein
MLVAEGTADELKRLVPGGHVRLQFSDSGHLDAAQLAFTGSIRDVAALALQIPSSGDVRGLRAVFDQLDAAGIDADAVTVHTPDLDDVFLALTGHPAEQNQTQKQKEAAR